MLFGRFFLTFFVIFARKSRFRCPNASKCYAKSMVRPWHCLEFMKLHIFSNVSLRENAWKSTFFWKYETFHTAPRVFRRPGRRPGRAEGAALTTFWISVDCAVFGGLFFAFLSCVFFDFFLWSKNPRKRLDRLVVFFTFSLFGVPLVCIFRVFAFMFGGIFG